MVTDIQATQGVASCVKEAVGAILSGIENAKTVNINVGNNSVFSIGNCNCNSNGGASSTDLEQYRQKLLRRILALNLPVDCAVQVINAIFQE